MSRQRLGAKWLRRIARVTGLEIVHASGNGTYWHRFTTADHRHGEIHATSLEWHLREPVFHGTSCQRLFPWEES